MRTTITINDYIFAKLKKRAADSGTSMSRLIEQAVRLLMQGPAPKKHQEPFKLVTFGKGGQFSKRNVDKTSGLIEDDNGFEGATD